MRYVRALTGVNSVQCQCTTSTVKNPTGVQAGSEELKRRTSGQTPVLAGVPVVTQTVLSEELLPQRAR